MNSLPFEIQQLIYEFDGRYKTAMVSCFNRIRARRSTPLMTVKDPLSRGDQPKYYKELDRRVKFYLKRLQPDGTILVNGIHLGIDSQNPDYIIKDALGVYRVTTAHKTLIVDGEIYISAKEYPTISIDNQEYLFKYRKLAMGIAPYTRVQCLDILEPELQKKLRSRKDPVKAFQSYGLSPIGIPYIKTYRSLRGPDGSRIYKQLEGDIPLVNKHDWKFIIRTVSSPSGVYKVLLCHSDWRLIAVIDNKIHWINRQFANSFDEKIEMILNA